MFGLKQSVPVALITAMCLSGCGGQSNQPSDPSAAASQRLQGDWRLLSFAPSIALEPLLQGLLDAQLQALNINFANGQFTAVGPGVDTSGRYEITNAAGDSLAPATASAAPSLRVNSASPAPTRLGPATACSNAPGEKPQR
jgi:hypothetical protein